MNHLVFVYGSLKHGFGNHRVLGSAEFIGPYVTPSCYTMRSMGAFPFVEKSGDTPISGEIYEVDEDGLRALDCLEGHPTFYKREKIDTDYGEAWIYFINNVTHDYPVVDDGVWR